MNNADMPAMPQQREWQDDMESHLANPKSGGTPPMDGIGLTKREQLAAMAMQGLLASDADGTLAMETNVRLSVEHADALLAELERTS